VFVHQKIIIIQFCAPSHMYFHILYITCFMSVPMDITVVSYVDSAVLQYEYSVRNIVFACFVEGNTMVCALQLPVTS
jgi:hypothetical protein